MSPAPSGATADATADEETFRRRIADEATSIPKPRADIATRFSSTRQPVKHGRSKEFNERLHRAFIREYVLHFEEHGTTAIERVFETDPATYLKIGASLMPKEIDIRASDDVDSERIERAIDMLNAIIDARGAKDITETVKVVGHADD